MDQIKRRDAGIAYIADKEVMEQQKRARKLTQELNTVDRSDFEKIEKIVKELLGKSEGAFINPPFYCDYGFNIEVGKNFYANYNCTILDVGKVTIGDNCMFAPNVAIYTGRTSNPSGSQEIVCMSMESRYPSVIIAGWEEIRLSALV